MLFIDITTTRANRWRVPHGIPRVEREVVRAFRDAGDPVTFVRISQERGSLRPVSPGAVDLLLDGLPRQPRSFLRYLPRVPLHALGRFVERTFRRGRRWLLRTIAPSFGQPSPSIGSKEDWFLHVGNNWRVFDTLDQAGFAGRLAFLVFDIIPLTHPSMFDRRFADYMIQVARRADIVFTISRFSRDCILREFPSLEGRVVIIPLGFDHLTRDLQYHLHRPTGAGMPTLRSAGVPTNYVLSVGKLNARKNQAFLLDVLERYAELHGDPPNLVLAGSAVGEVYPDFIRYKLDRRPWLRKKLVMLEHVDDALLEQLYAGCRAFLFPSLVEGWGMPITEAVAAGKPVLTTPRGASAEAGLGFARLIEPDVDRWCEALSEALKTPPTRQQQIEMHRTVAALRWAATVQAITSGLTGAPVRFPAPLAEATHPQGALDSNVLSAQ